VERARELAALALPRLVQQSLHRLRHAAVILDRLLHHAHTIASSRKTPHFDGERPAALVGSAARATALVRSDARYRA
jgi:hypothetical protein